MKKVLIANRGEIAVRIARALADAELTAVAVYSEADEMAHHVRLADEAYAIGGSLASESYLNVERLLEVAKRVGCDAVHPGYGFLSESAEFAEACAAAGLTFIGPPASAIRAMGEKISAREVMGAAGVPIVPGGPAGTLEEARSTAERVGYPIMLKPSSGGGGKGMRRIQSAAELADEWSSASLEAERAFADGTMYIEKCLLRPRHVEVQVLGDQHGNAVHLFERDCSIQRRHQKVIEETPSPALSRELAAEMGATSIAGAQALGYYSAGTFEYLLDEDGSYYFLEMNTRLQVEHGVTELTTGIDLVRAMLDIAAGLPLPMTQSEVTRRGHAMECRVYAENPSQNFMPSPGQLERLVLPSGPGVRNDEGALAGDSIPGYYDPLISKLLVWGQDRTQCLERMRRALNEYVVEGLDTNLELLRRVVTSHGFRDADYDTAFLGSELEALLTAPAPSREFLERAAAAAALLVHHESKARPQPPASAETGVSEWVRQQRSRLRGS